MIRTAAVLITALMVFVTSIHAAEKPKETPVGLERKLYGAWQGGDCVGELCLRPDGTFERQRYTPGGNKLSGTWEVRWDALPATLILNCKAADSAEFIGQEELKLVQLDDESLIYRFAGEPDGRKHDFTRVEKTEERELEALQGTWLPLQFEEGGRKVQPEVTRHIIKGYKITVVVNGQKIDQGEVIVDPTKNPKQLDFQFASGQTHSLIYVRAGDHIIYCGNRDGKTRPSEFISGTANGGEYLMTWKIEK